jgi:hypothetical protein
MDVTGIGTAITGAIDTVADKFFVDANQKQAFKLKALELQQQGEFKAQEIQLSAILAEAKSSDPWTSRARPSFLWVIYIMILCGIPMGILSVFSPAIADQIADGMRAWLAAIPEALWHVFGIGYLGYTGAREYGKSKLTEMIKR